MTTPTHPPTDEQQAALDVFASGVGLAIEAGAGCGKTSTLEMLARSTQRRGQYVAFNRAIVEDARARLPNNVTASTAHSLAFRAVGHRYKHRLNSPRMRSHELAKRLGVDRAIWVDLGEGVRKSLQPSYLASLTMRTIANYCFSDAAAPGPQHVPYVEGIDLPPTPGAPRSTVNNHYVAREITPYLTRAWDDIIDVGGGLPFNHDVYLKIFEQGRPSIGGDFILFDEAQDASPVMLSIVKQQTGSQGVWVGDSCQPTGTLVERVVRPGGARRPAVTEQTPIEALAVGDLVVSYNIAQRHLHRSGSPITGISSRPFNGDLVTVKAAEHATRYTPEHRCVVKIGNGLNGKHLVYLMRSGFSFRVGRAAARYGSAFGPMMRAQAERADALWVLSAHDTAEDAAIVEARVAAKFGIPMMLFRAANNRLMSQPGIDDFWLTMGDLRTPAAAALTACGRDINYPLWSRGGDRLLIRRTRVMYATNVISGMHMRTSDGEWVPVTVSRERYDGLVWSMDVDRDHTYVADGVITHNCQQIYGWRGSVNAMARADTAARTTLTQSFRFGPAIATVANIVLAVIDADLRLRGLPSIPSTLATLEQPDAVLTRTNAVAVETVMNYQRRGVTVHLVGGGAEVASFARAARDLKLGGRTEHRDLACFDSWAEVLDYVECDPQGSELALLVGLVEDFGVEAILRAMDNMPAECDAEVIVSTAHKAKGREWDRVQLAGDFGMPGDDGAGEWRLLYVAATRARLVLDVTACEPLFLLTYGPRQPSLLDLPTATTPPMLDVATGGLL